jgi:peptidoglycan DL-endopeptidase CwlO
MQKFTHILATGLVVVAGAAYAAEPSSMTSQPTQSPASSASSKVPQAMPMATAPMSTAPKQSAIDRRHAGISRREVEHVQEALNRSGASLAIDGIWGTKTEVALKQFQQQHALKVTGHLDHKTRQDLSLFG